MSIVMKDRADSNDGLPNVITQLAGISEPTLTFALFTYTSPVAVVTANRNPSYVTTTLPTLGLDSVTLGLLRVEIRCGRRMIARAKQVAPDVA
jgi:hypothetical protein